MAFYIWHVSVKINLFFLSLTHASPQEPLVLSSRYVCLWLHLLWNTFIIDFLTRKLVSCDSRKMVKMPHTRHFNFYGFWQDVFLINQKEMKGDLNGETDCLIWWQTLKFFNFSKAANNCGTSQNLACNNLRMSCKFEWCLLSSDAGKAV